MKTPYIGLSNETLNLLPKVKMGEVIKCTRCMGEHVLEPAVDGSELLLFYHCGENLYLAAVDGRLVVDINADVSGEL